MKYKKCHGAPPPMENRPKGSIYTTLRSTYDETQKDAEREFIKQWGFVPNPSQLQIYMQGTLQDIKDVILIGLKKLDAAPEYLYTVDKLDMLLTGKNAAHYDEETQKRWDDTLAEYREAHPPEIKETDDAPEPEPTGST
jgi:hypothetical protein